jgi:uncharacterized protein (DUF2147 family)
MKKLIGLIFSIFFFGAFAQHPEADRILGTWLTSEGKAHIVISRYGDKFGGKIVWLKEPNDEKGNPKTDHRNPDPTKRNVPTLGLNNLLGFTYDGDGKYEDGTIYDPANGKTYSCVMTLDSPDVLKVRGYIGFSLLGRTETWTRVK